MEQLKAAATGSEKRIKWLMNDNPECNWAALEDLQKVARVKPNSILVVAFFDAKSDELINIFNEGNITVRRQAYDVLKDLDPSKTEKYSQIIKN